MLLVLAACSAGDDGAGGDDERTVADEGSSQDAADDALDSDDAAAGSGSSDAGSPGDGSSHGGAEAGSPPDPDPDAGAGDPAADDATSSEPTAEAEEEAGEATAAAAPSEVRYVALGDSIAVGTGADTSYVDEYAVWLEEEIGTEVIVTRVATDGWTTDDLLSELRGDDTVRTSVADAHVVTLNAGGNDLVGGLRQLGDATCRRDVAECLDTAVADVEATWDELLAELVEVTNGDVAGVRAMDIPRPALLDGEGRVARALRERLDIVNDHLATTTEDAGVPFVSVHEAFHGPDGHRSARADELLAVDGVHPSTAGHELIAEQLAELGTDLRRVE